MSILCAEGAGVSPAPRGQDCPVATREVLSAVCVEGCRRSGALAGGCAIVRLTASSTRSLGPCRAAWRSWIQSRKPCDERGVPPEPARAMLGAQQQGLSHPLALSLNPGSPSSTIDRREQRLAASSANGAGGEPKPRGRAARDPVVGATWPGRGTSPRHWYRVPPFKTATPQTRRRRVKKNLQLPDFL